MNLLELDMGIFMYKCQNKLLPGSITNLFRTVDSVHSYQTRAAESGNLHIPKSLHSSAQKSISNKGAKIWNEIPCEIRDSGTIHSFKGKLREHHMKMHAAINISYISAYTDASPVVMMQLIFLVLFIVSSYLSIYLADLSVVVASDRA